MSKPKHGRLYNDNLGQKIFCPGKSSDVTKGILLPDLSANNQHLLDTGQLFHGHTKFHRVFQTRNQVQLRDFVLRHVSAHGLYSFIVPSSFKKTFKHVTTG